MINSPELINLASIGKTVTLNSYFDGTTT